MIINNSSKPIHMGELNVSGIGQFGQVSQEDSHEPQVIDT